MAGIEDFHRLVVDEYMINGFNGRKAVMKYRPNVSDVNADGVFRNLIKSDKGKVYFSQKRNEIRASINIEQEQILQQLLFWLRSDATDYLSMSPEELKALPDEAKQCIESIVHKKKSYTDRGGNLVVDEHLQVKLISKVKAMEILNKMLGYYELDNMQKQKTIDISKASPKQLNAVLELMQSQIEDSDNTIDI